MRFWIVTQMVCSRQKWNWKCLVEYANLVHQQPVEACEKAPNRYHPLSTAVTMATTTNVMHWRTQIRPTKPYVSHQSVANEVGCMHTHVYGMQICSICERTHVMHFFYLFFIFRQILALTWMYARVVRQDSLNGRPAASNGNKVVNFSCFSLKIDIFHAVSYENRTKARFSWCVYSVEQCRVVLSPHNDFSVCCFNECNRNLR